MLVIDFLQLISDLRKQTTFFYRGVSQNYALTIAAPPTATSADGQPCLVLTTTAGDKTLHQWELLFLLNKPEYYQLPLYVQHDAELRPVFGFRMVERQAWLH